ncbi:MAG: hypothetical protein ACR2H5_00255 [Ktedonobacteraceae bacterium]
MDTLEEFHKAVEELTAQQAEEYKKNPHTNYSWGNFLLSSIVKCADEETLTKMIADIKGHINLRRTQPNVS